MATALSVPCEASGLHKWLGSRRVLDGVDLTCASGEVVVVRGPNGCGKSTLLAILSGLIEASRGHVRIAGHRLDLAPADAKARLGYVPDGLRPLPDLLVSELLALVQALHPEREVAARDVAALRDQLGVTPVWHRRLGVLSFGQRKRALLLAALWHRPALLVLDEPCNGLDPPGRALIEAIVEERRQGMLGTVVATNDDSFAEALAGTEYTLVDGRLRATPRRSGEAGPIDKQVP